MRLKARILHWWRTYWSLGRRGERAAARLLRSQGYRVLARNARVPMGEADLVCLAPDGKTVVVVMNQSDAATPFYLWVNGDAASWTIEGHAIATLVF